MKKIMKELAFVAAFAAVAGYGVYANQQSETMSDLENLANVEKTLAGSEYDRPFYVAPCKMVRVLNVRFPLKV